MSRTRIDDQATNPREGELATRARLNVVEIARDGQIDVAGLRREIGRMKVR